MIRMIDIPVPVTAAGSGGKLIEEFAGLASTGTPSLSVARMTSPQGWEEPAQTPEFDEFSLVLEGTLRVETKDGVFDVPGGRGILAERGERVRYSTPFPGGAVYVAVCVPAFSPGTVHRDGTA